MNSYWRDKVAIITGGSAGFGAELARALVQAQSRVVLVARDAERLQAMVASLQAAPDRVLAVSADVTRDADVARMVSEARQAFGRIDALFNNAGLSDRGDALTTPLARFQELWELNFLAALRCTQAAAGDLRAARGHVVLIGSLASKSASRYLGAYPASKFPLAALAQQLRLEVDRQELHTLLVCPGPIRRADAGARYTGQTAGLPAAARQPGGGVKLKGLDPQRLAARVLTACERRQAELILPARARLLFTLQQLAPRLGDWLIRKMT